MDICGYALGIAQNKPNKNQLILKLTERGAVSDTAPHIFYTNPHLSVAFCVFLSLISNTVPYVYCVDLRRLKPTPIVLHPRANILHFLFVGKMRFAVHHVRMRLSKVWLKRIHPPLKSFHRFFTITTIAF
jgi:hypothetical protein